jgi:SAM-dependent methyltransferase
MITSQKIYSSFAPYYRHYSERKSKYLSLIDQLVLANLPNPCKRILDVGCGDGVRGTVLFTQAHASEIWMIDNCQEMYEQAKQFDGVAGRRVMHIDITHDIQKERLPRNYFDVSWCLWGVLGHITEYPKRIEALAHMKEVIRKEGRILIDVSNRYNVACYGWRIVTKNLLDDIFWPNRNNGTVEYKIKVADNKEIDSCSHFFSPKELPEIFNTLDLKILKSIYVDYRTGALTNQWGGQMFYVLEKS